LAAPASELFLVKLVLAVVSAFVAEVYAFVVVDVGVVAEGVAVVGVVSSIVLSKGLFLGMVL
jgi:hypothetical protein